MSTQKENNEQLCDIVKKWQDIEVASIKNSQKIANNSKNPLIKMVFDVIKQDSEMHMRAQQLIIDHFEKESLKINPDELIEFWDLVEEHARIEKQTIDLAKEALEKTNYPLVQYILEYILTDEEKHDKLLDDMEKIKKGMYPYSG